ALQATPTLRRASKDHRYITRTNGPHGEHIPPSRGRYSHDGKPRRAWHEARRSADRRRRDTRDDTGHRGSLRRSCGHGRGGASPPSPLIDQSSSNLDLISRSSEANSLVASTSFRYASPRSTMSYDHLTCA